MNHEQLKRSLKESGSTCIAFSDCGKFYESQARGIVPLFELCEKNINGVPLYVGDKVIGKAAALLCARCNVVRLYAGVVSESALTVLAQHGIYTVCGQSVDYIANRSGDGKCPMEQLAKGVSSPDAMYQKVARFLAECAPMNR